MSKFKLSTIPLVITITFLLSDSTTYGQAASGYIRYEERVDVHRMIAAQMAANPQMAVQMNAMKAQIEQYSSAIHRLYFSPTESMYKAYFEDRPISQPGFGNTMRVSMGPMNNTNQYYTDSDMMISQIDFIGQTYLIADTIKMAQWKFGEGTRTILGYECQLAYYTDTTNPEKPLEITAWYTSKIRAFIGPERYNTLPGGILALDVNNGEHYWVARKIEIRDLTAEEKIERPIQGKNSKKVTYEQYLTVQQEREKKVKALNGGR